MHKYDKIILNTLYWDKDRSKSLQGLNTKLRAKMPDYDDDYFKNKIKEMLSENLIEFQTQSNLFYTPIANVDMESGESTPVPKDQQETIPLVESDVVKLTTKGFTLIDSEKSKALSSFRAFIIKTGLTAFFSHLLVSLLLFP